MSELLKNIHWLGHAGFRVEGSKIVYFDPFNITGGHVADIILVTHTHYDHFSPDDINKISDSSTTLVISSDADPAFPGEVIKLTPGGKVEIAGFVVKAVPAYNIDKKFHPKANNWLGFLLAMDGETIYHTGDTDFIPEMKGIEADVSLIPVGGTYTMNAAEAASAVKAMKVKVAVPMHWGEIVGDKADALKFKELVGNSAEVAILERT